MVGLEVELGGTVKVRGGKGRGFGLIRGGYHGKDESVRDRLESEH